MALYLISYDIDEKDKKEYEPLWALLKQLGAVKILYSEWIIKGGVNDAEKIYDKIMPILKEADRLLVHEVAQNAYWDKLLISDEVFAQLVRANARG
jgi:CRISPR-associated endonuclease Cas2